MEVRGLLLDPARRFIPIHLLFQIMEGAKLYI